MSRAIRTIRWTNRLGTEAQYSIDERVTSRLTRTDTPNLLHPSRVFVWSCGTIPAASSVRAAMVEAARVHWNHNLQGAFAGIDPADTTEDD